MKQARRSRLSDEEKIHWQNSSDSHMHGPQKICDDTGCSRVGGKDFPIWPLFYIKVSIYLKLNFVLIFASPSWVPIRMHKETHQQAMEHICDNWDPYFLPKCLIPKCHISKRKSSISDIFFSVKFRRLLLSFGSTRPMDHGMKFFLKFASLSGGVQGWKIKYFDRIELDFFLRLHIFKHINWGFENLHDNNSTCLK